MWIAWALTPRLSIMIITPKTLSIIANNAFIPRCSFHIVHSSHSPPPKLAQPYSQNMKVIYTSRPLLQKYSSRRIISPVSKMHYHPPHQPHNPPHPRHGHALAPPPAPHRPPLRVPHSPHFHPHALAHETLFPNPTIPSFTSIRHLHPKTQHSANPQHRIPENPAHTFEAQTRTRNKQ
jgi:hypothetical protein